MMMLISGFGTDYNTNSFECGADAAGSGLFLLVISEFFIGKLLKIVTWAVKDLIRFAHAEYSVSEAVIELLYL